MLSVNCFAKPEEFLNKKISSLFLEEEMENLLCLLPSDNRHTSWKLCKIKSIYLQAYFFLKIIKSFSRLIPVLMNGRLVYFSFSFRKGSLEHPRKYVRALLCYL